MTGFAVIRVLRRIVPLVTLLFTFLVALVVSAWRVAMAALSSTSKLEPAIVAVPIELETDLGIATLANLVTLTPGTTALHVADDRKTLYVHVLDAPTAEAVVRDIKDGFERLIKRIEQ